MKKIYSLIVASVIATGAFAQCTVSPIASLTVLNPLPTDGLPDGYVGTPYSESVSFSASGQAIDPLIIASLFGFSIPSIPGVSVTVAVTGVEVLGVSGLPAGFTAVASDNPASWGSGESGCYLISGTPTTAGDNQITFSVNVTAEYSLNGGTPTSMSTPQPVPMNYSMKSIDNASISEFATAGLNLFPNPATDVFSVSYPSTGSDMATIEITDMSGKLVYSAAKSINAQGGTLQVNTDALANGLYRVTFASGSVRTASKLMVRK